VRSRRAHNADRTESQSLAERTAIRSVAGFVDRVGMSVSPAPTAAMCNRAMERGDNPGPVERAAACGSRRFGDHATERHAHDAGDYADTCDGAMNANDH
jgi:hypothetical protein